MKILCLFLRYGEREYPQAFSGLRQWYVTHVRKADPTFWIVDNMLPMKYDAENAEGIRVLGGDNAFWEFSGWDAVVKSCRSEIEQYDIIHFVTSAYNTLYTGYLNHFDESQLEYIKSKPSCLGHIDSYDSSVQIRGFKTQHWIRTCFFFLSYGSLVRIGKLLSCNARGEFFDKKGQWNDGPVSANYIRNISDWLNGQALQGVTWHSKILDLENFQQKAMAILNEHMLSVRMRECGLELIDFCWLRHALARETSGERPAVESWERQVALRSRVLSGEISLAHLK